MKQIFTLFLFFLLGCTTGGQVAIKSVKDSQEGLVFKAESANAYYEMCGTASPEIAQRRFMGSLQKLASELPDITNDGYFVDGNYVQPNPPMDEGCDVLECSPLDPAFDIRIEPKLYKLLDEKRTAPELAGARPVAQYKTVEFKGPYRLTYHYYSDVRCEHPAETTFDFER
ncbi:MAG: hypothetical protein ACXVBE_13550 [Bdellovibrionota bacterium]